VPDFAGPLGANAIGIFGSDRPAGGFDPGPLNADARALYEQFAPAWKAATAGWLAPTTSTRPVLTTSFIGDLRRYVVLGGAPEPPGQLARIGAHAPRQARGGTPSNQ